MIPVHQKYFYVDDDKAETRGDCWRAAIASILELDADEVPHFIDLDDKGWGDWWWNTCVWLQERGLKLEVSLKHPDDGYYIVTGKSPRGEHYHCVVYKGGQLAHDPHPGGAGVRTEEHFVFIREEESVS